MIDIKYNYKWNGYQNFRDITNADITKLQAGSQNSFIHDGEKIEPRAGTDYFGAAGTLGTNTNTYWTLAHRIHSKYDDFVNNQGIKMPFRVFYSGTTAQGDVIETWLPVYSGGVATAAKQWYQITATAPASPVLSSHRYYWAEWYDNLNFQNRVVFTYGSNTVKSYTGGFTPIQIVNGTTLSCFTGTWAQKGFIDPPEGVAKIVVNVAGVPTEVTVTSTFNATNITVTSTAGMVADDIAFQGFNSDSMPTGTTADVCSMLNNQVYYIDWNQRKVLGSWNRNRPAEIDIPLYVGVSGLNDATFSGTYTGTITQKIAVTIDSVAENPVTFIGQGADGLVYDTSGYTQAGTQNTYKVVVFQRPSTSSNTIYYTLATGIFWEGETVTGGTSGATGSVVYDDVSGHLALTFIVGTFTPGETITGGSSGVTATVVSFGPYSGNFLELFYIAYKNGVNVNSGPLQGPTGVALAGAFPVADGITFSIPTGIIGNSYPTGGGPYNQYQGSLQNGDSWEITITNNVDTFAWSLNGVPQASHVPCSTSPTLLTLGVSVTFGNVKGHAIGDLWEVTLFPNIVHGWINFYFTTPVRYPGEGFSVLLDSNGWTMKPQEKYMYVNVQAGHFYNISTELSANLQSETVKVERLKSEPQSKILQPYLIGYIKNQLATISLDKTYDILGRQKFLELPQTKSISDEVRVDFETADWVDADILYYKRKIYFCVPRTGLVFVWDDYKKYWHSPMQFARRISLLSVIDDKLVGHSYERNESYEMFVGLNDLGIYPIETKMVFAYNAYGKRYSEKQASAIGFEGYIAGAPQINYKLNWDIAGCNGQTGGVINPFLCLPNDKASLGKSNLGFHGLGNDPVDVPPHFYFIQPFNNYQFYMSNLEISCNSMDQRWSIVSWGLSVQMAGISNTSITASTSI